MYYILYYGIRWVWNVNKAFKIFCVRSAVINLKEALSRPGFYYFYFTFLYNICNEMCAVWLNGLSWLSFIFIRIIALQYVNMSASKIFFIKKILMLSESGLFPSAAVNHGRFYFIESTNSIENLIWRYWESISFPENYKIKRNENKRRRIKKK